jgi:dimethylhistidine N-methyltransferase
MRQIAAEIPLTGAPANLQVFATNGPEPGLKEFARDVIAGLNARPKTIPPKYFYDRQGSELFDEICRLPEYYLTRTETALLRQHAAEIAALAGPDARLIEFGSGASAKVRILLDALRSPAAYVAVDISREYLMLVMRTLAVEYPDVAMVAICADFTQAFGLPRLPGHGTRLGFFPGSTIGNLDPAEARAFLRHAARVIGPDGGLLIGVDLKKEPDILNAAYNDGAGITAAFNLNLLTRINRELGGQFDLSAFAHAAHYDEEHGRIEMHLRSLRAQTVAVGPRAFTFAADETIHTENSYKYTTAEFHDLARAAGLAPRRTWVDADQLFSMHYLDCTAC